MRSRVNRLKRDSGFVLFRFLTLIDFLKIGKEKTNETEDGPLQKGLKPSLKDL